MERLNNKQRPFLPSVTEQVRLRNGRDEAEALGVPPPAVSHQWLFRFCHQTAATLTTQGLKTPGILMAPESLVKPLLGDLVPQNHRLVKTNTISTMLCFMHMVV